MSTNSPLSKIFVDHEQIPTAFQEQFLAFPEQDYNDVLEGEMHRIWHRPRWLKPLFLFLGWLGILVPNHGEAIKTTQAVNPGNLPCGAPFHEWIRTFAFKSPIQFNTRVVFDEKMNNLADQVGPNHFLHMVWKGTFIPPRTFTLDTVSNAIQFGDRRWYMPKWLWLLLLGRVKFIQQAHEDDENVVDVDLRILHPWFGEVFGYKGTFHIRRFKKIYVDT